MADLDLRLTRNKVTFVSKKKHSGTASNYNSVINNFENFCMEKYGKVNIFDELKQNTEYRNPASIKDPKRNIW